MALISPETRGALMRVITVRHKLKDSLSSALIQLINAANERNIHDTANYSTIAKNTINGIIGTFEFELKNNLMLTKEDREDKIRKIELMKNLKNLINAGDYITISKIIKNVRKL